MKELDNNSIGTLLDEPAPWSGPGPYNDVVLSTSVSLSRNIYNVSFPNRQEGDEVEYITSLAKQFANVSAFNGSSVFINIGQLTYNNRRLLKELGVIRDEADLKHNRSVVSGTGRDYFINVNDEDHFNITVTRSGLQIDEAYKTASEIDDELNRFVVYAFSDSLGYITSDPRMLGTGLKVSTLLHLPVLSLSKKIYAVFEAAGDNGLTLSGMDGEEKKVTGSLYRLSNRESLGMSEADIIRLMDEAAHKIIDIECSERDVYQLDHENRLADKIFRSYGILKYARSIDYPEAADCLSDIRLGIMISLIKSPDPGTLNELIINCRQSHLEKIAGRAFIDNSECSIFRASYLRDRLERSAING